MNENSENEKKTCTKCKHSLLLIEFKQNRSGIYTKLCKRCLDACKKSRDKNRGNNKCEHNTRKDYCKICKGSQICDHGRIKDRCKDCNGTQICEHGIIRSGCKPCGGSQISKHGIYKSSCRDCNGSRICDHSRHRFYCKICNAENFCKHGRWSKQCRECSDNPLEIVARDIVRSTKYGDKLKDKFDEANHIDLDFVIEILTEQTNCHYCDAELQYVNFESDMATIERLDNKLGHIKSNCVIACRTCNLSRVGDKLAKLI